MIGLALHLGAVAVDEAREAARGLSWAASFAASAARLALAARLDPEAARAVGEVAALRAEQGRLRAAALAILNELEDLSGDPLLLCEQGCDALAMRSFKYGYGRTELCDEHACEVERSLVADRPSRVVDLSYAPALRALRALLVEVPRG